MKFRYKKISLEFLFINFLNGENLYALSAWCYAYEKISYIYIYIYIYNIYIYKFFL